MASADIIAAIATPPGRGGIGVVRISGKNLQPLAQALLGKVPPSRHATLCAFLDERARVIDQGIALYFPAPRSYTAEDVLELHGHGGPMVLQLLLGRCLALGARLAEPGEFTKRAFLNDKLDLAQAESVADLIDASTQEAARCAMRSLRGEFSAATNALVKVLTELRMLVEATLDFPDEEIDFLNAADARVKLQRIQTRLEEVMKTARQGSLLREGVHAVLVGQTNVGKSSLLNQLAGEEVAIVTEIPGTTRDAIRQAIEIEGVPLHIIDTAGLRESQDTVEKIGMARTRAALEKANLAMLVMDSTIGATAEDHAILASLPSSLPLISVYNKIDLLNQAPRMLCQNGKTAIHVSAKTGEGIDLLRKKLLEVAGWQPTGEGVFMARARHLQALTEARQRLQAAAQNFHQLELLAEELRLAQRALSTITGEFTADDLLGEIFSRFCIGK